MKLKDSRHNLALVLMLLLALPSACRKHDENAPPDLGQTSPLNQPGGPPATAEAYALYSSLYRITTGEPLAFAAYSATDIPQVDGMCLKPTNDEEKQMTDAFQVANRQTHSWQRNFSLKQGYALLSRKETEAALRCVQQRGEGMGCDKYHGLKVVRFLGMPGFNADHTRALVSVIKSCGSDCGSGGIFLARKTAAGWDHEDPTPFTQNCSWAY